MPCCDDDEEEEPRWSDAAALTVLLLRLLMLLPPPDCNAPPATAVRHRCWPYERNNAEQPTPIALQ
jgi:hypothetical protein